MRGCPARAGEGLQEGTAGFWGWGLWGLQRAACLTWVLMVDLSSKERAF